MKNSLLLALALSGLVAPLHGADTVTRPNIVFLLADDLGWADLGCYGSPFHQTPHLDRLAREGTRFTSFYSAGAVCSPTRSSIQTGKYPPRTGITDWIPGQQAQGRKLVQLHPASQLALEELTFAEVFKTAGYQTFYTGKWHLGGHGFMPTEQGFDEYVGDETALEESGQAGRLKRRLESTDRFTRAATGFLDRRDRSRPFLLFVSYHDVHTPIQPMPGLVEPYEAKAKVLSSVTPTRPEHQGTTRLRQDNAAYASMVAALDESLAGIRRKLEDLGLKENTILIFTSDNGGLSTQSKYGPTSNEPLRAGKGWLYEGGIRVPLIVRGPGIRAGGIVDAPLISCDFYPTVLELAGLPLRPRQHLDGVSFAQLLRSGTPPETRPLFWHYPHYHGSTWTPGAAVRNGKWKLIEFYEEGKAELYDLETDPSEERDLASAQQTKAEELLAQLHDWQREVKAQVPSPNSNPGEREKKKKRKQSAGS